MPSWSSHKALIAAAIAVCCALVPSVFNAIRQLRLFIPNSRSQEGLWVVVELGATVASPVLGITSAVVAIDYAFFAMRSGQKTAARVSRGLVLAALLYCGQMMLPDSEPKAPPPPPKAELQQWKD